MKRILRSINQLLPMFGITPIRTFYALKGLPHYLHDRKIFQNQMRSLNNDFPLGKPYLCLGDRFLNSGSVKGHYFHQDLLVARRIHLKNPNNHVDVGSRIDGFVAHLATFRSISVIDIRPLSNNIPNIKFIQADLMSPVQKSLVECCDSLSCLHALEHFGLGRYGDSVNYNGHIFGLDNLYKILKKGGKFYISVPIGPQRTEFNAHRVFSVSYLMKCFEDKYNIDQFSYVDDQGDLHENITMGENEVQRNFGCLFGCGIFEMTKL